MVYLVGRIDVEPLLKALKSFEKFRVGIVTERDRAGAIQAFEYTFELAWKTMKRFLSEKGLDVRSPKDCFREAAILGIISNPKKWFMYIDMRNLTVHTYKNETAEEIVQSFDDFSDSMKELMAYIENERKSSEA